MFFPLLPWLLVCTFVWIIYIYENDALLLLSIMP
uniref:Uncharacterized protein n=1 Tax=Rhizophora mucronata TaxID=61149 RepID=A0A2P2MKU4_RHIMU